MSSPAESAISESPNGPDAGYFPNTPRSSMSSILSARSELLADNGTKPVIARAVTVAATSEPPVKLDPLQRHYPKPTDEVKLEELLARPPLRYSLGHYVKTARDGDSNKPPAVVAMVQREDIEDSKRELLRAHEELKKLGAKRR